MSRHILTMLLLLAALSWPAHAEVVVPVPMNPMDLTVGHRCTRARGSG